MLMDRSAIQRGGKSSRHHKASLVEGKQELRVREE